MSTRRAKFALLLLLVGALWGGFSLAHASHVEDSPLCAVCATGHALSVSVVGELREPELASLGPILLDAQQAPSTHCPGLPGRRGPPFHG